MLGRVSYEILTTGLNVRIRVGTTTCILTDTACEDVNLLAETVVTQ